MPKEVSVLGRRVEHKIQREKNQSKWKNIGIFGFLLLSRDERGDVLKITSTTLIRPSDVFNYVKLSLSLT